MQYVQGYSALVTGALVLAFTLPQAGWGIAAGFYVSATNHYKLVIVSLAVLIEVYRARCANEMLRKNIGAALWTIGLGLQLLWSPASSMGMIVGFLEISAIGIGFNLQTSELHSSSRDWCLIAN